MLFDLTTYPLRSSIKFVELLVAILGTVYFYKYNYGYLKFFLIIIWYTAINEFFSYYLKTQGVVYTIIYYNVYHLLNFSFLFLLYKTYVKRPTHKKYILVFFGIYILSFFINMFFQDYTKQVQTIPYFIASLSVITCIIFYFSQILNSNEILLIKRNLLIYISVGYLLYLTGNLPVRIMRNYFAEMPNLEYILNVSSILSILMNLCFITGFICSDKKQL